MRFSVEILDHIFSFLVSHQSTLFACSKDPVLSQIIERQLYYHTTVHFATEWLDGSFEPDRLSELISENPRICNYVRVLQIQVELDRVGNQDSVINTKLDEFADTLLMFPLLQCIMLTTSKRRIWFWPDVFRAALEDRLKLPTVKEVHLVGRQDFPFSLIGNCKNIENLLLSGSFEPRDEDEQDLSPLQLKSLTLPNSISDSFAAEELHINKLQSLKCAESAVDDLPELLGVCSQTLNKLDIDLTYSKYSTNYTFQTGKVDNNPLTALSPTPSNLQQLTIRAPVLVENQIDEDGIYTPKGCWSYLPAVADIINSFVPSPRHLVLDISIHLFDISSNLANVDFSPLAVLGAAALSIPHIDLYVHADTSSTVTLTQLLSSLVDYQDVMKSIEDGRLIIHSERTAPDYVED